MSQLDVVIPVYNEGENILALLDSLRAHVKTPLRVLICFDRDNDTTLPLVAGYPKSGMLELMLVKNEGKGVHGAIIGRRWSSNAAAGFTGLRAFARAPRRRCLFFPATRTTISTIANGAGEN